MVSIIATGTGTTWQQVGHAIEQVDDTDRQVEVVVPITLAGGTVPDVAAGKTDAQWTQMGKALATLDAAPILTLATTLPATSPAGQSAEDRAAEVETSKTAYRRAADLVQRQAPDALLAWQVPTGADLETVQKAWPGADAVDVAAITIQNTDDWPIEQARLTQLSDWLASQGKRAIIHWSVAGAGADKPPREDVQDWLRVAAAQNRLAAVTVATGTQPTTGLTWGGQDT